MKNSTFKNAFFRAGTALYLRELHIFQYSKDKIARIGAKSQFLGHLPQYKATIEIHRNALNLSNFSAFHC